MAGDQNQLNRILIFGFSIFSLAFLLSLDLRPYDLSWLIKTIPIGCLAIWAFLNLRGKPGILLGLGFVFSGIGDILLELPFDGLFEAGMGAFILAHCFYTALFLAHPQFTLAKGLVMVSMVVFTLWFGAFLFPVLGGMMVPIYVYLGVILCMGISACLGRDNHWIVIAGAIVFIISDSLIAWTRFVTPIPHSSLWVMLTYYLAQAMLALGAFRSYPVRD